jgi:hypothetical protein
MISKFQIFNSKNNQGKNRTVFSKEKNIVQKDVGQSKKDGFAYGE